MSTKRLKQYLMLLTAIGLVSVSAGSSGTFASFSAEVQNTGNYFATGTLYLHATNDGTNWCTSESSGDNMKTTPGTGNDCGVMFTPDVSTHAQYAHLTLKNAGTLDASDITWQASGANSSVSCTSVTVYQDNTTVSAGGYDPAVNTTSLPIDAATFALRTNQVIEITDADGSNLETATVAAPVTVGATSITLTAPLAGTRSAGAKVLSSADFTGGTGDLCDNLHLTITETDAAFDATQADSGTTGAVGCAYGPTSGSGCLFAGADALSGLPTSLTPLTLSSQGTWSQKTGLDHGQSRYFLVGVEGGTTTNGDQGKKASFNLLWHIDQATS